MWPPDASIPDAGETDAGDAEDAGKQLETDAGRDQAVELEFEVTVGGRPFSCAETYDGVGSNPDAGLRVFRPKDARFYVHGVALTDSAGAAVPVTLTNDGRGKTTDWR